MFKKIFFFLFVFVIGGIGGAFFSSVVAPKLSAIDRLSFLAGDKSGQTVIVNKTEQIIVEREQVLERVFQKTVPTLVVVESLAGNTVRSSGTGFVVSSDGLVLTRSEWVSASGSVKVKVKRDGREFAAEIVKTSPDAGLALLKIEASNLPVVSLVQNVSGRPGLEVFLVGLQPKASGALPFVNSGIVKSADGKLIETNIEEDFRLATGAPLLNAAGDVVGIGAVNSAEYVFAVSAEVIKEFLNL